MKKSQTKNWVMVISALLMGIFTLIGTLPFIQFFASFTPSHTEVVTILSSGSNETGGYIARGANSSGMSYFIIVQRKNNEKLKLSVNKILHDKALVVSAFEIPVELKISHFFNVPTSITLKPKKQVDILDIKKGSMLDKLIPKSSSPSKYVSYSLVLSKTKSFILFMFFLGVVIYLYRKYPNKNKNKNEVVFFLVTIIFSIILGFVIFT